MGNQLTNTYGTTIIRKIQRSFCMLFVFYLGACTDAIKSWVTDGTGDPPGVTTPSTAPQMYTWDFSDPTQYTFDTTYLDVADGKVSVKQVDQLHSGSDFNSGGHVGTTYLNGVLTPSLIYETPGEFLWSLLPQQNSLIESWSLDGDGNGQKSLYNLSTAGTVTYGSGFHGGSQAADFSASGTLYVSSLPHLNDFTVSMWFFQLSASTSKRLIEKGDGFGNHEFLISQNPSGYYAVNMLLDVGSCDSDLYILPFSQWHSITVTFNAGILKVYINGLQSGNAITCSSSSLHTPIVNDLFIGNDKFGVQPHNGKIDDISLWSSGLTASEVLSFYNQTRKKYLTELDSSWVASWSTLVGYWKMDGNWQDSSGNGHHGTPRGDSTFSLTKKVGSQSALFDGVGDRLDPPNSVNPWSSDFSFGMWVYNTDTSPAGHQILVSKESYLNWGFRFGLNGNEEVQFWTSESGGTISLDSNYVLKEFQWYQIFVTFDHDTSTVTIYVDGRPIASGSGTYINPVSGGFKIGEGGGWEWVGHIDDFSIWNSKLKSSSILEIYNRQKQKFAGHYDSPIIDLGIAGQWDNFAVKTTLPFYKELSLANESSSQYSLLNTDLANGLLGYWSLSGTIDSAVTLGVDSILDTSGNSNHGSASDANNTTKMKYVASIINMGIQFSSTAVDEITMPTLDDTNFPINGSLSLWIFLDNLPGNTSAVFDNFSVARDHIFLRPTSNNVFQLSFQNSSGYVFSKNITVDEERWNHIVMQWDTSNDMGYFYLNGELVGSGAISDISWVPNQQVMAFSNKSGSGHESILDDVALWNRVLNTTEIQQLYRRGGNRIKYQVKSCVDAACKCKSLDGTGDDNDCDGDGTANANDLSDLHFSEWLGKDGATGESFSELQNCSLLATLSGDCDFASMAIVNATSPDFEFNRYPMAAGPINNRYFQYRALMEAEENLACGGSPCMPELISVAVGPAGRYYGGTYTVTSSSTVAFIDLNEISFTTTGSCSLTYQLSPNGTTYYYWNGSIWTVANGVAQSTTGETVSTNISSFAFQAGTGNLYWKAFMNSTTNQSCEIAEIAVKVAQ